MILKYRPIVPAHILSRGTLLVILTGMAAFGYALIIGGLSLVFGESPAVDNPLVIGATVFLLAMAVQPFRLPLQKRIDAVFFRGRSAYRELLLEFSRKLVKTGVAEASLSLFRDYVDDVLAPSILHIYTYTDFGGYYSAAPDQSGRPTSDLRFSSNSSLVQTLSQRREPVYLREGGALSQFFHSEPARLALLGAELFLPISGPSGLAGWLALGRRISGEPYTPEAIEYLEALCDLAGLALERARVVGVLERRVQEMDTIARMAQGINITVAFDDLLEMYYAQISRLLPITDFHITFGDEHGQRFTHVFYLENDERLSEQENTVLGIGECLDAEAIRTRRPIVTDEYARECAARGITPATAEIHAWMSLPLNSGTDTIGAVSLGCRDPLVSYTPDQVNLLQALADLLAGAILKARFLEESELRARQMSTLNDLTRSLTSTLDLDPLLERILQSAVEILDCESGSLLLVDEHTGELVFTVALGPVGADLVGQRLPSGAGLVGKAVKTRQPIIQNDARRSADWYNTDRQTGYSTKDLLVVPLEIKDRVIGVLEVLNKKDHSPFNWDDLELLTAFAGQAAVAIENARLYTQTDQALAARVGELSVMQRIDRELNAGLDLERAMRITLEWSLNQSKAQAGLVGLIEADGVRVMAAEGIAGESADSAISFLPEDIPTVNAAIESGTIQCAAFDPHPASEFQSVSRRGAGDDQQIIPGKAPGCFSPGARHQLVVPVRRDQRVIGVILLESASTEAFPEEVTAFLSRLSDHAAIAFSNAQLYAAVQAANLAKSQFVSSVAHELKNPLTSIKGYSDLLISGAVGPVSEGQGRFLATIRSNANRMSTLVSDLQDISRIEAGQLRLQFSAVSFVDIVNEVARTLRKQIEEKGQSLAILLPEGEPMPLVWGDNTRLVQILTNLLSNAHKYTPRGGRLVIQARVVDNQWDSDGAPQVVHVSVADNGIGISPEDQRKVFQQFFRSEDPKVREVTGTGLGLNITRRLVEMQGGAIWFESTPGKGTTFHFTIPVADSE
jgi:signal transduction histidine kinase